MRKKIVALSMLLALTCAAQTASGLPYTGTVEYNFSEGGRVLSGHIDFGVFDTEVDYFGLTPPGDGQYIYAYQIFNDQGSAQEAVGYFAVLLGGAAVDGVGTDFWQGDTAAVEPNRAFFDDEGDAVFLFQEANTEGDSLLNEETLKPGMHSCVIMFTSDNDWQAGDYQISGGGLGSHETVFPGPTPEPATIFILAMGAGTAFVVKKKSS